MINWILAAVGCVCYVVLLRLTYLRGDLVGWTRGFREARELNERERARSHTLRNVEPVALDLLNPGDRALLQALLELDYTGKPTIH